VAEPAIEHLLDPIFHAANASHDVSRPVSYVISLLVATYLHMLFGEMVPKNIALADPVRVALLAGPPLVAVTRGLRPLIFAVNSLANAALRLVRVVPRTAVEAAFSDAELSRMVGDAGRAGLLDERAAERLRDALELGRRPVGGIVLPSEQVVRAPLGITAEELEELSARTGFSRFPVAGDDGRMLGYLHVKDALEAEPRNTPLPRSALRRITRVGAATPLDDVLTAMRAGRAHLAAVVDEEGRGVGLVTMEDVLKDLVGRGRTDGQGDSGNPHVT
jgi:CBS domain containing-hemolysin-like protein